jgi:hypothetical protein
MNIEQAKAEQDRRFGESVSLTAVLLRNRHRGKSKSGLPAERPNFRRSFSELFSQHSDDPRVPAMLDAVLNDFVCNEVRASLPGNLRVAQALSHHRYVLFEALINNADPAKQTSKLLRGWLGFEADF